MSDERVRPEHESLVRATLDALVMCGLEPNVEAVAIWTKGYIRAHGGSRVAAIECCAFALAALAASARERAAHGKPTAIHGGATGETIVLAPGADGAERISPDVVRFGIAPERVAGLVDRIETELLRQGERGAETRWPAAGLDLRRHGPPLREDGPTPDRSRTNERLHYEPVPDTAAPLESTTRPAPPIAGASGVQGPPTTPSPSPPSRRGLHWFLGLVALGAVKVAVGLAMKWGADPPKQRPIPRVDVNEAVRKRVERARAPLEPEPEPAQVLPAPGPFRCGASVSHVACAPDGRRIATADRGRALRIWDAETGAESWSADVRGHLRALVLRADGSAATADTTGRVRVWRPPSTEPESTTETAGTIASQFVNDGEYVVHSLTFRTVAIPTGGGEATRIAGSESGIVLPIVDGGFVLGDRLTGIVRIFDAALAEEPRSAAARTSFGIGFVARPEAVTPDGSRILRFPLQTDVRRGPDIECVDVGGKVEWRSADPCRVFSIVVQPFAPDRPETAAAIGPGEIVFLALGDGAVVRAIEAPEGTKFTCAAFSPTGADLWACCADGRILRFDAR
ncbi:MAG: hypothetical protein HMLKMBBP_01865 [Planctomycetes bacterium]|nr:hypothetical protein [Planctomycetota bacterium]